MFALVDCNACYASCEQVFRPDLRGKPIVVLSNNDGCIVTRNAEAKALGVPDLEPYFKLKPWLEKQGVHVFSSNYELYGDISSRIMALLASFADKLEIYSIDEAFLDLGGFAEPLAHAREIRRACWQQQRMPVSIGIAHTKTLAKLANHIAKRSPRLKGICLIDNLPQWEPVFRKLPITCIWGIGRRLGRRLQALDIASVADFRRQPPRAIRKQFGVTLERTLRELNGERCLDLDTQPSPKKQIFCSRSFAHPVTREQELRESVAHYAVRAAEKLRQQRSVAGCVHVMVQSSRFITPHYSRSLTLNLPYATNDSRQIVKAATELCHRLYRPGVKFVRAGVGLLDLAAEKYQQADLFSASQSPRDQALMKVMDQVNRRFGKHQIFLASQGIAPTWAIARQLKSPAYTTRLAELPRIKL